jgi:hypothetical protein
VHEAPPKETPVAEAVQISESVTILTQPVENALQKLPPAEQQAMQPALEAITKARQKVEQSSQGKGFKGPPPWKGKKGKGK